MNDFLYPIVASVSLIALLFKLRVLRNDRSPAQVALIGNFFLMFVTFTVSTPVVWAAVSSAVGITNFSGLLTQSAVILSAACQQLVLLHLTHNAEDAWRKARPRLIGLGLVLAAMITLFASATSLGERPDDFALAKAQYYPAYLGVYLLGYIANQIDVGILGWRCAKVAPTPWLKRGLYLIALTLPFAMIYGGCRLADIIAGQFGTSGHGWEPVAQIAVTVATIIKTAGWTVPDWGPTLSAAWQRVDDWRAYRELASLHRAVTAAVPETILALDNHVDLRTRLYRLMVEVRDAQWALRTWMTVEHEAEMRCRSQSIGLEGANLAAAVEAEQLRYALRAKKLSAQPHTHAPCPRVAEPQDLAAELEFQRRLARAFKAAASAESVFRRKLTRAFKGSAHTCATPISAAAPASRPEGTA
ncbi:MAB_1171c family putative transporter [Streptomyces sp. NPDC059037]|uniref:MAB_1171c family putative transporter n=1 Tax=Streptomyces sp. NPDC059037 TaxID=3346710 RepID=UPI0036CC847E